MRVDLTLPWPHTPASAWESPTVFRGRDTQFLFRKRLSLLPQLKETNLGGGALFREGPPWERYENKGNNILTGLGLSPMTLKIRLNENNHHVSCYIIKW